MRDNNKVTAFDRCGKGGTDLKDTAQSCATRQSKGEGDRRNGPGKICEQVGPFRQQSMLPEKVDNANKLEKSKAILSNNKSKYNDKRGGSEERAVTQDDQR